MIVPDLGPWMLVSLGFGLVLFLIPVGLVLLLDRESRSFGKSLLVHSVFAALGGIIFQTFAVISLHRWLEHLDAPWRSMVFFGSAPLGFALGSLTARQRSWRRRKEQTIEKEKRAGS